MNSNGDMSEYAVDRDQRPLLDQEGGFSETEILERLRDSSPRYGTFVAGAPPPVIVTERIVEPSTTTPLNVNTRPKRYRLSFLILLSFDIGLIIFLSVMCYLTSSDPGDHTVAGYFNLNDFDTSVFDLVLVSVTRFVFNVVFYLLLGWITRIILFLTTLLSTLYVPVKAFFFWERLTGMDQNGDKIIILYIIVLLLFFSAFAIPWLIAFFFEFKYLPTERSRITVASWFDYRPWLCPWMLRPKAESPQAPTAHNRVITTTQQVPASLNRHQSLDTVFRTPVGSNRGSPTSYLIVDDDLGTIREENRLSPSPELLPAECDQLSSTDARFCQMGDQALQGLTAQVSSNNGWRLVKEQDDVKCYCSQGNTWKIYKAEMIIPISADRLWAVIYHDVENTKNWNSGVAANEILQKIDHTTDILYTLCTTIGPVSPRDFVTVRRWDLIQGVYYDANVSTQHSAKPIQRDPVRGENGPGGYAVIPVEAQKCKFVWVFNSNLKGWILRSVLEQIVPTTLVNTSKSLRSYVCGLSSNA